MKGTILNVFTVIFGSLAGKLLGAKLPERFRQIIFSSLGLVTIAIGLSLLLKTTNILLVLASLLFGGLLGEWINIDAALERFSNWIEKKIRVKESTFSEGFITASLVFCVGPMTILGSFQDGLKGDFSLLAIKSMLDGFAALAFASTLGWGVAFSSLTVFFYQGFLTLGASFFKAILTNNMINEMTATGGLLIFAIGLKLLEIKEIRVANLLPAIFISPFLVYLVSLFGKK